MADAGTLYALGNSFEKKQLSQHHSHAQSSGRRFRDVTFPLLNPTLVFLTVVGVIGSLQVFTQIRNMTSQGQGGPLSSTISLVLYVYRQAFEALPSRMGYASAMTVVLFLMILVITIVQLKVLTRNYEY